MKRHQQHNKNKTPCIPAILLRHLIVTIWIKYLTRQNFGPFIQTFWHTHTLCGRQRPNNAKKNWMCKRCTHYTLVCRGPVQIAEDPNRWSNIHTKTV